MAAWSSRSSVFTCLLVALTLLFLCQPSFKQAVVHSATDEHRTEPRGCYGGKPLPVPNDEFTKCISSRTTQLVDTHSVARQHPNSSALMHERRARIQRQARPIIGLVWYGRAEYVRILWPYLRRNVRSRGGVLSQLWVVVFTHDQADRAIAATWASECTEVRIIEPDNHNRCGRNDSDVWNRLVQGHRDAIFVRVDDDTVFVKDGTIEALVDHVLTEGPRSLAVANVVNHCQMPALHQALGAWRAPAGVEPFHYYGSSWTRGELAVAQLEAFLHNYHADALSRYSFAQWDLNACRCTRKQFMLDICHRGYYRWCINFFAVSGALLDGKRLHAPDGREESWISAYLPHDEEVPHDSDQNVLGSAARSTTNRPVRAVVLGESLVVHFAYGSQRECPSWASGEHPALLNKFALVAEDYTGSKIPRDAAAPTAPRAVPQQLVGAIDVPAWLPPAHAPARWLMHPMTGGFLKRTARMRTVVELIRRWEKQCHSPSGRASDCEAVDALEGLFWGQEGGYVLELGALDGTRHSESRLFSQATDARRILIEADPTWRQGRRDQWPDAVGVTAAVCSADAIVHYLSNTRSRAPVSGVAEFMDRPYLQIWYPALASKGDLSAADWSALPSELAASNVSVLPVACVPLLTILDALGLSWVDFFILDTEGAELSILRTIDWTRISFGVIVVEVMGPSRRRSYLDEVLEVILATGQYEVLFPQRKRANDVQRNVWLVHRSFCRRARKGVGSKVFARNRPASHTDTHDA